MRGYREREGVPVNSTQHSLSQIRASSDVVEMAAEITDVVVTYKDVMAPVGYRKVTSGSGDATVAADLNHGRGGTPVYLWFACKEGDTPVAELAVVYCNDSAPTGFRKLDKDLTKGVDSEVFLCLRAAAADASSRELVLTALTVQYSEAPPGGEGWLRVEGNLNRSGEGEPVYLWYQRAARRAPKRVWRAQDLQVGDYVDALDTAQRWAEAQVLERDGDVLLIHYLGWADKVGARARARGVVRVVLTASPRRASAVERQVRHRRPQAPAQPGRVPDQVGPQVPASREDPGRQLPAHAATADRRAGRAARGPRRRRHRGGRKILGRRAAAVH